MAMLVSYMIVSIDVLHVNFRHELSVDVPESLSPLAGHNVETLGLYKHPRELGNCGADFLGKFVKLYWHIILYVYILK